MKTKTFVGAFDRLPDEFNIDDINEHLNIVEQNMKGEMENGATGEVPKVNKKQSRAELLKSQFKGS